MAEAGKKRWDFIGRLKGDPSFIEQMCWSREFQVDCVATEKTGGEKLFAMPDGLTRRFVLEERKDWDRR